MQVLFLIFLNFLHFDSIANLNSTLIWNLILQIPLHLTVEFNLSQISVKLSINMSVSSRQEGSTYE